MTDRLIASKGCGSVLVEAVYALLGLPLEVEMMDYKQPGPALDRLLALNPLGQVPTLIREDGTVLTESAAIVLQLADAHPGSRLSPTVEDPRRAEFLRWLFFLVAAIYPTFTFGDRPERFVDGEAAGKQLRASTDRRREDAWRQMEAGLTPSPWLFGAELSLLDVYVGVMSHWRPRRAWFAEHCPRLHAVAEAMNTRPELAVVWKRNFGA